MFTVFALYAPLTCQSCTYHILGRMLFSVIIHSIQPTQNTHGNCFTISSTIISRSSCVIGNCYPASDGGEAWYCEFLWVTSCLYMCYHLTYFLPYSGFFFLLYSPEGIRYSKQDDPVYKFQYQHLLNACLSICILW